MIDVGNENKKAGKVGDAVLGRKCDGELAVER
jgi:hypothetical protein